MSLVATLLVVSAIPTQQPPQLPAPIKMLVIELPDGVRGGVGRIKGKGVHPTDNRPFFLHLLTIASECGANFPMYAINWSHRAHIVSWSTDKDRDVVACLRSRMPTHFNAGIAEPDHRLGFTVPDTAPFREFETAGKRP
ncbi:hypothetical protein [Sphingomonas koreensis]